MDDQRSGSRPEGVKIIAGPKWKPVDEASGPLRKILGEVRTLQKALDTVKKSMTELGAVKIPGVVLATDEAKGLGDAWERIAVQSKRAAEGLTAAGRVAQAAGAEGAGAGAAAAAAAGGGRRGFAAAVRGGAFGHATAPGVPLGGGSHFRPTGPAGIGAGIGAFAVYEDAKYLEEVITQGLMHEDFTLSTKDPARRKKLRDIIEEAAAKTGAGMADIGNAVLQELRMFDATPGGGMPVLPQMLEAAWFESLMKGTTVADSMEAMTGLAHMTKEYSPEAIAKLAPVFAFLSARNPASLKAMERAASYAVPILQSGLEIDPLDTLLAGTVLTRAGATNTKSGTWLREMALRAMPGTSLMSKQAYRKHEGALRALGLVDSAKNPTWFNEEGKPDLMKMLEIASEHAADIPLTKRAALERQLFGAQGAGAFSLLADPAVKEQMTALKAEMDEYRKAYPNLRETYGEASPMYQFRTTWALARNILMDLGAVVLPSVSEGLKALDTVLKAIHGDLPWDKVTPGAAIGSGFAGGALGGYLLGGPPGALIGGGIGAAGGLGYWGAKQPPQPLPPSLVPWPSNSTPWSLENKLREEGPLLKKMNFLSGPPGEGSSGGDSGGAVYLDAKKVGEVLMGVMARGMGGASQGSAHGDYTAMAMAPGTYT